MKGMEERKGNKGRLQQYEGVEERKGKFNKAISVELVL